MNGLETAIRSALERSDRTNAEMRARIYQSARHALESGLRKQNITDAGVIGEQRHRLEAIIHAVEQEERARLDHVAEQPPEAAVPHPGAAPEVSAAPDVRSDKTQSDQLQAEPDDFADFRAERDDQPKATTQSAKAEAAIGAAAPGLHVSAEPVTRRRKRRTGFYSRLFVFAVLLASAGIGGWWAYTSGVLMSATERDTAVRSQPPTAEEEDFTGEPTLGAPGTPQGFSEDWVKVFEPNQIASLQPRANAVVDVVAASDGSAVRVLSRSGDADGNVEIAMPVAILREMAGKTSTIAITLQSASDQPVQVSVECDFDRLGDCARHRFTVNPEKNDVLLRVSFERAIAPSTPGKLLLNADLGGKGEGVNLYSVRVLPGR